MQTPLTFASLFTGIGGFDLAFERAGMQCLAQVEIDKQARSVLDRHFPNTSKFEDVTHVGKHNIPAVNVLAGGFPCQDLSVAGKRRGLVGERSGLWYQFHRIIFELAPRYVVIENVPGLLSSGPRDKHTRKTRRGLDFAIVLTGLTGVVPTIPVDGWGNAGFMRGRSGFYNVAWRVLDAQYFGVAQRRRRVFIVASLGNGRAAEILFEREGGAGDIEAIESAREGTTGTLSASAPSRRNGGSNPVADSFVVGTLAASGAGTMRPAGQANELDFLVPETFDVRNMRSNGDVSGTLQAKASGGYSLNYINPVFVPGGDNELATYRLQMFGVYAEDDKSSTLAARDYKSATDLISCDFRASASTDQPVRNADQAGTVTANKYDAVSLAHGVRRLTPTECERLQGFPDGWTAGQSDSARYKQLGNAVAVPVVEWIGRRIVEVEA